jgi:CubicO group peptidase (beta-lactamase class C family)
MKQPTRRACWIVGALLLLGTAALGQYFGRPPTNPYTGAPLQAPPSNPLTAVPPSPWGNPLTGAPPPPQALVNPYTGRPMPSQTGYNPMTGRLQPGMGGPPPTAAQAGPWPRTALPVSGKAGPGLEPLDKAVLEIMERHGIPGGALALAKDGKLVYAKGFGWADLAAGTPADPWTLFGLASVSKPITALAILLLLERGQLALDDRVFNLLRHIKPARGARVDPRLKDITVRQLLNHTGGWDRAVSGDPINWSPQIARALNVPLPLTEAQFTSFMMGVPLDFAPGTRYQYSNVGYVLLGQVIEKVSGQRYEDFVRANLLEPLGIDRAFATVTAPRPYRESEARAYLAGTGVMLPPMNLPMARAAGGWSASALDLVRLLTALDGSRGKKLLQDKTYREMLAPPPAPVKARPNGTYPGLGWVNVFPTPRRAGYTQEGSWQGMRTFLKCNPARGVNWALLFNASMDPDPVDARVVLDAVRDIQQRVERLDRYPAVDLFKSL